METWLLTDQTMNVYLNPLPYSDTQPFFFFTHITVCPALWQVNETTQSSPLRGVSALLVFTRVTAAPAETNLVSRGHIYCRTRRQTGGREPHQPPRLTHWYLGELRFVLHKLNYCMFSGEKAEGEITVQLLMIPSGVGGCFPACGACSLCRTRGQDRDQSTQLLFSSTGIISHANGIQRYKS